MKQKYKPTKMEVNWYSCLQTLLRDRQSHTRVSKRQMQTFVGMRKLGASPEEALEGFKDLKRRGI